MPTRDHAPDGSPCWADLWTSDVEGSRRFYGEPLRLGGPGAERRVRRLLHVHPGRRSGGRRHGRHGGPARRQQLEDLPVHRRRGPDRPGGRGRRRPDRGPGHARGRPGRPDGDGRSDRRRCSGPGSRGPSRASPSWASTARPAGSSCTPATTPARVDFYRSVFGWETDTVGDSDEFRYTTMRDPRGEGELAGVMDATGFLPDGVPADWSIYWEVDDVDAAVAQVARSADRS